MGKMYFDWNSFDQSDESEGERIITFWIAIQVFPVLVFQFGGVLIIRQPQEMRHDLSSAWNIVNSTLLFHMVMFILWLYQLKTLNKLWTLPRPDVALENSE